MKRLISVLLSVTLIFSLAGITPVSADNTAIASVEVTQVMGKGIDMATGKYYFMNTFVANKPASIQVVMNEPYEFSSSDTVTVYRDGSEIATITPDKSERTQIMTFTPEKSAVDSWAAGRYKFTANIGGSEHSTEAIFNESKEFSVLAVGASVKYNGEIIPAPYMDSNTITLRTQAIPVSENKLVRRYIGAPISFGTGENGYDLADPGSQLKFLSDIENYRLKSAANYDVVIVVVDSYISDSQQNGGYTDSNHAVVLSLKVANDSESLTSSLLHELGHIFGNGDEYEYGDAKPDVNGLPYGISATNSNGESVTGNREYFTHADGNTYSGIIINDVQNPYNPKSGGVMLNTSSFMGSSYTHWTTSMVWEEAYEKLIPNYQNVLPKVYTDGTLVPERNLDNTLSDESIEELRNAWYEMCNEVHTSQGHNAYNYDEIFKAAEGYFQQKAEEAMKKGETEMKFDLNDMFKSMNMWTGLKSTTAHIEEWTDSELETKKDFFTYSECGKSWMKDDYMVIAFMEVGGRIFHVWTTFSDMTTLEDEEEVTKPQPETAPVLEVNPADNNLPTDPSDLPTDPADDPNYDDSGSSSSSGNAGLPAFEDYTEEMKSDMLSYDVFSIGMDEHMGSYDDTPYMQWDNAAAYLGWWAGQEFGTELSGDEVKAIYEAYEDKNQLIISNCIAEYFDKVMIWDQDGNVYPADNYPDYEGDGYIEDPDGEW
jgi:hypothetical protein